jgi:hypothetical protein
LATFERVTPSVSGSSRRHPRTQTKGVLDRPFDFLDVEPFFITEVALVDTPGPAELLGGEIGHVRHW